MERVEWSGDVELFVEWLVTGRWGISAWLEGGAHVGEDEDFASYEEAKDAAESMKRRLESIPGVTGVEICGDVDEYCDCYYCGPVCRCD